MITNDSGRTTSLWMDRTTVPSFGKLDRDLSVDVCVVGAGIAGLTTAYLLALEGRRVAVIDDGPTAGGETARTTAHLAWAIDDRFSMLEKVVGPRHARLAGLAHQAAVARIEWAVREEGIDCGFERVGGYLFSPAGEGPEKLLKERDACHRLGFTSVRMVERAPTSGFDTGPALLFPSQALFHPLAYLEGLTRAITSRGGQLFNGSRVKSVSDDSPVEVKTDEGQTVRAQAAVVATNSPINDMYVMHTKQAPYRTYAIGLKVPKDAVHNALYWDTLEYYHYVRLERGRGHDATHDVLIVGGADHKTGQAHDMEARYRHLEQWARERFPQCQDVAYRWSGQVMETIDGLAYIGRNPREQNVYIATGDSGMGMTHGTLAGIILSDLIQGRPNPWAETFSPSRKTLRAARDWTVENLNVARMYADWLTPGEVESGEQLSPGQGALMRRGASKVCLYKDDEGRVHACSAVCTHLQCIVSWNPDEKSWDCPCHGSRFDPYGRVLNGPAISDLAKVEER